jgi:hypothetical protein
MLHAASTLTDMSRFAVALPAWACGAKIARAQRAIRTARADVIFMTFLL